MDDLENTPSGGDGEALSLEEAMTATMEGVFEGTTEESAEPATNRDAQGRFTKTATEIIAESADPATGEQNDGDQGNEAEAAEPTDTAATRAPASWSPAAKAAFDAANPAIQAEVLKREADINKALQTHAEERKQFAGLQQVLGTRAEALVEEHGSVEQGITDLFKISDYAEARPEEFIQWFAQQRGVDLTKLVTGQPGQVSNDPVINSLKQQVQAISQHLTAAVAQQEQAKQADANRQIETFKTTRPHFEAVRVQMGKLIEAGMAEGLEDAYDMAVHANPATRKQIFAAQAKTHADDLAKEASDRAARARKAAGTNLRAHGAPTTVKGVPRSIDQTLAEVYDRQAG